MRILLQTRQLSDKATRRHLDCVVQQTSSNQTSSNLLDVQQKSHPLATSRQGFQTVFFWMFPEVYHSTEMSNCLTRLTVSSIQRTFRFILRQSQTSSQQELPTTVISRIVDPMTLPEQSLLGHCKRRLLHQNLRTIFDPKEKLIIYDVLKNCRRKIDAERVLQESFRESNSPIVIRSADRRPRYGRHMLHHSYQFAGSLVVKIFRTINEYELHIAFKKFE